MEVNSRGYLLNCYVEYGKYASLFSALVKKNFTHSINMSSIIIILWFYNTVDWLILFTSNKILMSNCESLGS